MCLNQRSLASCQVLCSLLDVSHGDFDYLESRAFSALVSTLRNLHASLQSWPSGVGLATADSGSSDRAYSCEVAVRFDPVSGDTLG